jgi:hypothetical protein
MVAPARMKRRGRSGLTLIEVLLATALLSLGLVVMMTAISRCLIVLTKSTSYHKAMWALNAGEAEYPLFQPPQGDSDPADFEVSPEDFGGVTYERTIEDPDESADDNEVRLLVVRTKLSWEGRGKQHSENVTRYFLYRER